MFRYLPHSFHYFFYDIYFSDHLDCDICVEAYTLLIGGRNLNDWRTDAEIWDNKGRLDMTIPPFPFRLGNIHVK